MLYCYVYLLYYNIMSCILSHTDFLDFHLAVFCDIDLAMSSFDASIDWCFLYDDKSAIEVIEVN